MNEAFERLLTRAEALLARIESVLPQPLAEPDWQASVAFRYRKRAGGHGVLEPVRHVAQMALDDLREIDDQKEKIRRNTCLLYTSPSPRDKRQSRMPSSA